MIRWTLIDPDNPPVRNKNYLFLRDATIYTGFIKDETEVDDTGFPVWYDAEGNRYAIIHHYAEINLPDYDYDETKEYFLIAWSRRSRKKDGTYTEWERYNTTIDIHPVEWIYKSRKEFARHSIEDRIDWAMPINREQYLLIDNMSD